MMQDEWLLRLHKELGITGQREIKQIRKKQRLTTSNGFGYVYIARIKSTDIFKIGRSRRPGARIRELQTFTPYDFELVYKIQISAHGHAESKVHNKLKQYKIRSEWYRLSDSELNDTIDFLKTLAL